MKKKRNAMVDAVNDRIDHRLQDLCNMPILKVVQVCFIVILPDGAAELVTYGEDQDQVRELDQHFRTILERMGCDIPTLIQTEWPALTVYMSGNRQRSTDELYRRCFVENNLK